MIQQRSPSGLSLQDSLVGNSGLGRDVNSLKLSRTGKAEDPTVNIPGSRGSIQSYSLT